MPIATAFFKFYYLVISLFIFMMYYGIPSILLYAGKVSKSYVVHYHFYEIRATANCKDKAVPVY